MTVDSIDVSTIWLHLGDDLSIRREYLSLYKNPFIFGNNMDTFLHNSSNFSVDFTDAFACALSWWKRFCFPSPNNQ